MSSPYDLLLGLALLNEKNQHKSSALKGWTGVLVKAENQQILIERNVIKEIVTISQAAPVIDKRKWLTGLMSYEGELLSLIELRRLINPNIGSLGLKNRQVIVINKEDGDFGLLVDQIIGSRHYWLDDQALSAIDTNSGGLFKASFFHKGKSVKISNHHKMVAQMGLKNLNA